jgi:hypothetical protein
VAQALRQGNRAQLDRLAFRQGAAQLREAAVRRGGERRLGERLAGPGAARRYTHTPLVVAFVVQERGRPGLILMFQWHDGSWRLWHVNDIAESQETTSGAGVYPLRSSLPNR